MTNEQAALIAAANWGAGAVSRAEAIDAAEEFLDWLARFEVPAA